MSKFVYILQGCYEGRWEDLFECEDREDAHEQLKTYNENEWKIPHRVIVRRIHDN